MKDCVSITRLEEVMVKDVPVPTVVLVWKVKSPIPLKFALLCEFIMILEESKRILADVAVVILSGRYEITFILPEDTHEISVDVPPDFQ